MVPCEIEPGGILYELGIFGPKILKPKFHLIPYLPVQLLTREFWVERTNKKLFERLIAVDQQNGNHNNVTFVLLMCGIYFPDCFFSDDRENLDWLFSLSQDVIGERSRRIVILTSMFPKHSTPDQLGQVILECNFEYDGETFKKIPKPTKKERFARVESFLIPNP